MDKEKNSLAIEANNRGSKEYDSVKEYKLFEYFKEHPAFFVTVVSFALAVVTFLCNFLNNAITRIYLQKWSIDTALIGPPAKSGTFYYFAIFSLVYFFVLNVLNYELKSFYSGYFSEVIMLRYCREIYKTLIRKSKNQKKRLRKIKRNRRRNHSYDEEEYRNIIREVDINIKQCNESLKSIQNLRKTLISGMMWKIFAFSILLLIPSTLQQLSFGRITFLGIVITWALYSLFYVFIARVFSKKTYREYSKERIVSEVKKAAEDNKLGEFFLTVSGSISQRRTQKIGFKDHFSDNNLSNLVIETISGLIFMIVTVLVAGILTLYFNKGYYTFQSDGKNYAVIYQNENIFYLEEAEEVDGTLIVDPSAQRIIKADDLSMQYKKYKKVIQTEDVKEQEILENN